jgi:cobaltochelatase CobS
MRAQSQTAGEAKLAGIPDLKVSVRQVFGIDTDLEVPAYSRADEHVPDVDPDYLFNKEVTLAVLAGFKQTAG